MAALKLVIFLQLFISSFFIAIFSAFQILLTFISNSNSVKKKRKILKKLCLLPVFYFVYKDYWKHLSCWAIKASKSEKEKERKKVSLTAIQINVLQQNFKPVIRFFKFSLF